MDNQLRQIIEEAWNDRALLAESRVREAVRAVIEELDKGRLRTAALISLALFAACFVLSYVVCALSAGSLQFWHAWGWFQN